MTKNIVTALLILYAIGAYLFSPIYTFNKSITYLMINILAVSCFRYGYSKRVNYRLDFTNTNDNLFLIGLFIFVWTYDLFFYTDYSLASSSRLTKTNTSGFIQVFKDYFYLIMYPLMLSKFNVSSRFWKVVLIIVILFPVIQTGQRKMISMFIFAFALIESENIKFTARRKLMLTITSLLSVAIIQLFTHVRGSDQPLENLLSALEGSDNMLHFLFFSGGEFVIPYSTLGIFIEHKQEFRWLDGWMIPLMSYFPRFIASSDFRGLAELFMFQEFPFLYRGGHGYAFSAIGSAFWRLGFLGVIIEFFLLGKVLKVLEYSARCATNYSSKFLLYSGIFTISIETIRGDLLLVPKIAIMTWLLSLISLRIYGVN